MSNVILILQRIKAGRHVPYSADTTLQYEAVSLAIMWFTSLPVIVILFRIHFSGPNLLTKIVINDNDLIYLFRNILAL